jgi:diadenosine tetraphosphate (Ap4A) HIT family hydrolase
MPEEKPCPFCHFPETMERVILETPNLWVALSVPNLMPGHVLVVPKVHVGAPYDLEPAICWEAMQMAMKFQQKMIWILSGLWGKPVGVDICIHTRPFMTQSDKSIPGHVHFHVRPRTYNDELYQAVQIHENVLFDRPIPDGELAEYRRLLAE